VLLHLLNEECVRCIKLRPQMLVGFLRLTPVASSLVNLLQRHPQLSSMFKHLHELVSGKKLELILQRLCVVLIFPEVGPCQDCLQEQAHHSTTALLLEAKLGDDVLAVLNASSSVHEGSEEDHLEGRPPRKLESLHQSTELRNVEVSEWKGVHVMLLLLGKVDASIFKTRHRKHS
jgi:hypothetical protein